MTMTIKTAFQYYRKNAPKMSAADAFQRAKTDSERNRQPWIFKRETTIGHGSVLRTRKPDGTRLTCVVAIVDDDQNNPPWENEDGHGPVSDWTRRDKRPGEIELNSDHGSKRYYDFQEACKIARRDGWGFMPHKMTVTPVPGRHADYARRGGTVTAGPFSAHDPEDINRAIHAVYAAHKATYPSARAYAAAAAMHDYEILRKWCADQWRYIGVCLFELPRDGEERNPQTVADAHPFGDLEHSALWGIESYSEDYHATVALELLGEMK